MQVKKKPAENTNWRIRDNQLYFFRPDPLKSSLDLDSNPWKLTVPNELRDQVLTENHDNGQLFVEVEEQDGKDMQESRKTIFDQECTPNP